MSKFVRNEDAFTGLEAAIVLIAFIVVAAVFSYVVLGAGFFTASESQRTVHTGVSQATSNLEVSGPVVVKAITTDKLGEISFFLQLAAGGAPVDMKKVTFTVSTADELKTYLYDTDVDPGVSHVWYADGILQETDGAGTNAMLDKFEMVKITISTDLPTIEPNDRFTVEVKPDQGAALPINRMAPADFQTGNYYQVY